VIAADGLLNFGLRTLGTTLGMASGGGIFSSSSIFWMKSGPAAAAAADVAAAIVIGRLRIFSKDS